MPLPISNALREAHPESISDLLSRPTEGMTDAEIDRIIEALRANRERMEAAEGRPKALREAKIPSTIAPSKEPVTGLEL